MNEMQLFRMIELLKEELDYELDNVFSGYTSFEDFIENYKEIRRQLNKIFPEKWNK